MFSLPAGGQSKGEGGGAGGYLNLVEVSSPQP